MKRIIVVTVALAFVLLSAGAALAGIVDSKHDMRTHLTAGFDGGYNEVCVYCHTPHNASPAAPLWNHSLAAPTTYNVYSKAVSSSMDATTGQPGSGSLLCLSCHDGTVAVDAMANSPKGTAPTSGTNLPNGVGPTKLVQGNANFSTDLNNDHPIGFAYESAITNGDTGLHTLASVLSSTAVRLTDDTQVECSSCHDAHNTANAPFLRSSNAASAMCLVCHNK